MRLREGRRVARRSKDRGSRCGTVVEHPTAVARVTAEAWVQSLAWLKGWVKGSGITVTEAQVEAVARIQSLAGNFYMPWVWP